MRYSCVSRFRSRAFFAHPQSTGIVKLLLVRGH